MKYQVKGEVDDSVKLNAGCCFAGKVDYESEEVEYAENLPVLTVFDPMDAKHGFLEIEYTFYLREDQ